MYVKVFFILKYQCNALLLRGSSPRKSAKSAIFLFLQKKGHYMWVDLVPKYYEASSTINFLNGGFYITYIYIQYIFIYKYIIYFYYINDIFQYF